MKSLFRTSRNDGRALSPPRLRPLGGAACLAVLCGCVTPSFEAPPTVEAIQAAPGYRSRGAADPDAAADPVIGAWWQAIGGDELDGLVRTLLVQNLDLEISRARTAQAEALRRQARGARLPGVDASVSESETRGRGDDAIEGGTGAGAAADGYSAALNANWSIDVFGELRSSARAARLSLAAAQLRERAAAQVLVAELARAWVGVATLERRLELQRSVAQSFGTTANLTNERYRNGSESTSAADVEIARANLASAEARVPELAAQLELAAMVIDTLLARLPGETLAGLGEVALPEELEPPPVSMPGALLSRRPDVAAAELELRAALADVGAARARLFPGLSLTSSLTFRGDDADAFDWDNHIATLASSLLAPIFQGGRLRAQVRAQQAVARELAASYGATALAAVRDVETALQLEAAYLAQAERLEENVRAAALANELSQNRYRQGLSSLLTVLEAQRSLNNARESLILAEQAWLESRIDLYLSLGGDWTAGAEAR